ncbi:MAG: STAS domain-containing protein [Magnetococcales bacterium]|nr:STAS domain-containing protein [Magnetococcales bacterium]
MIEFTLDNADGNGTLTLSGDITIQVATELKENLMKALDDEVKHLILSLDQVSALDLTGLQLICAAQRSVKNAGKSFTLAGAVPDAVRQAVVESGYVGCGGAEDNSKLWTGE